MAAASAQNPARAILRTGTLLAAFLVVTGAAKGGADAGLGLNLAWIVLFAGTGLVLVLGGALLMDRALLGTTAEEIARGNVAAGLVAASHRVGVAVIAARCLFGGDLPGLLVGGAFVALGVGTLLAFQFLHRKLTVYADDQEIRGQNTAAALSSAGLTVALAVIVGHAAEGTFQGWGASLRAYAFALLLACALYPVRQLLVSRIILGMPLGLRARALDRAIVEERSDVCGAVEGLC
jgi:uncharacterized membrane protein YjfL (UPF0719 family)